MLINPVPWISEILPGKLWQSAMIDQWKNLDLLPEIDVIVDLAGLDVGIPQYTTGQFAYVYLGMEDGPLPNDMHRFLEVAGCATKAIQDGAGVLSHCAAGINRSSLMSGQIIYNLGIAKGQAIVDLIRTARPGTLSNPDFVRYLVGLT